MEGIVRLGVNVLSLSHDMGQRSGAARPSAARRPRLAGPNRFQLFGLFERKAVESMTSIEIDGN